MFKMNIFRVILLLSSVNYILSEKCVDFETCSQCIGSSFRCAWCTDKGYSEPRCGTIEDITIKCNHIENPKSDDIKRIIQKNSSIGLSEVVIRARPGESNQFDVTYKPVKDYPIDVYYLFDNSHTMKKYKEQLKNEASKIYDYLSKTNNVHFGLGSFVEKLAPPFASEERGDKLNTFNNHLSLTNNISTFIDYITENKIASGSNLDDPEAGLDALMQVMVCDKEIEWREGAFKIVVMLTDGQYHSAGDGRTVGAYIPNDMKCYLDKLSNDEVSNHTYNKKKSLQYDYPSVSQISYIARKNNIRIFFSATEQVEKDYEALADAVFGATFILLENNATSDETYLAKAIYGKYKTLSQSLLISRYKIPSHLDVSFVPDCQNEKNEKCKVGFRGSLIVTTTVTLKSCPADKTYKDTVMVKFGVFDTLSMNVEALCSCDCEKSNTLVGLSNQCHSQGIEQCGICKCNDGWYGENCQCKGSMTVKQASMKCRPKAEDDECSGRGICECGKCKCDEGYGPPHCLYRTDDCPAPFHQVCSNHGKCVNNKCNCTGKWSGPDCSCSTDKAPCYGANGEECSGHGECNCGVCKCTAIAEGTDSVYTGPYCDICDTCDQKRCEQLHDYVVCIHSGLDGMKITNKDKCKSKYEWKDNLKVEIKNSTEVNQWGEGNRCTKVLDDGSIIVYRYLDGNNSTRVMIQNEKESPPETNIWIPIGSAIGAILLIGILTLIAWKVLVDIMDAREYRRFAEEAEKSGFQVKENPLYQPAAVNIRNPAYIEDQDQSSFVF